MEGIVIDAGSGTMKAGRAGEDAPDKIFPPVLGIPNGDNEDENCDEYFGDAVIEKRELFHVLNPISKGLVGDINVFSRVMQHVYRELGKTSEEHPLLLTSHCLTKGKPRDKLAEVLFEQFNVPSLALPPSSLLNMYSSGRVSGISVDIGHEATTVTPIYESFSYFDKIGKSSIAGAEINSQLSKRLQIENLDFVQYIKENYCYVPLDYNVELSVDPKTLSQDIQIKNETQTIHQDRFIAPEILFKPSLFGSSEKGIIDMIYDSLNQFSQNPDVSSFILLTGGSSELNGIAHRIENDLIKLNPRSPFRIVIDPNAKYSNWIGGSIFGSLSSAVPYYITKSSFMETGNHPFEFSLNSG